ncbi:hypothetical protein T265_12101 [Opisthorchis viverrini]|uniref:hydroxyacylglutathione hydrolase n=1 Tax=Opisthorchis viverrini TaxID=6198 RepID=A0A074Z6P4_OPIVI|nr:hypothetical protein T265_12101 [Opisthorchis viverrini]KER18915.1 hypothetical protein T265_12101 [Opisthorchis viverrini]
MLTSFRRIMDVLVLNAWSDNYMYLLVEQASKMCAAVDPVEPEKILDAVTKHGLTLSLVLTTHHRADHASGNGALAKKWKEKSGEKLIIYGGDKRVDALTNLVSDGEVIKVGHTLNVKCLATPCHTTGHICYYVSDSTKDCRAVFTGDTLFLGGCGRFFEGTPEQMHHALLGSLGKLPPSTKVYCGHEYTVKNLEFGLTVEPNNKALQERLKHAKDLRARGLPTVPGTIQDELDTNPFMRVDQTDVLAHAKTNNPIEAMRVIRCEKDRF